MYPWSNSNRFLSVSKTLYLFQMLNQNRLWLEPPWNSQWLKKMLPRKSDTTCCSSSVFVMQMKQLWPWECTGPWVPGGSVGRALVVKLLLRLNPHNTLAAPKHSLGYVSFVFFSERQPSFLFCFLDMTMYTAVIEELPIYACTCVCAHTHMQICTCLSWVINQCASLLL